MLTEYEMKTLVPKKLKEIEQDYNIEILWCAESGSRAWGFSSKDSDYDVRFIYKRKHFDYLKLNKDKDSIELPVDDTWDVVGFDLDKTLLLIKKSNPTIYEWLNSPITYIDSTFNIRIKPLLDECYLENRMLFHYHSMAVKTYKEYFTEDEVKLKKYFYVLRPILCCYWIMKYHENPPMLFDTLKEEFLNGEVLDNVNKILEYKKTSDEINKIKQIDCLTKYINESLEQIKNHLDNLDYHKEVSYDHINEFFYQELNIK